MLIFFCTYLGTPNSTHESYQNQHHQCINQNNYRPISSSNKQPIQYQQHIACYTENERTEWLLALQSASHRSMKKSLDSLRSRLRFKVVNDVVDDVIFVTPKRHQHIKLHLNFLYFYRIDEPTRSGCENCSKSRKSSFGK